VIVRACETQARLLGLLQPSVAAPIPEKPAETESVEDQLAASPGLRAALARRLRQAEERAKSLPQAETKPAEVGIL
jgi:hypothetical protein